MPYDEELANRVRAALGGGGRVEAKKNVRRPYVHGSGENVCQRG
jgi:hypothetical protein